MSSPLLINKKYDYGSVHDDEDSMKGKLGTLDGVTLPTILNVLSILMFLRFGFIIGQLGVLGTIIVLVISYTINTLTTMSVSAIATNGTVKGGGAYYMISRSLGVEFGGSIGVIFYIGQILNSSMNVAGVIEPLIYNFNVDDGELGKILPVSYWWNFTYCTIFLSICVVVALIGSNAVSKAGKYLCIVLLFSTLMIPISTLAVSPFETEYGLRYSGPSLDTLRGNLFPKLTKGAAGSEVKGQETFNDLFGIFFPATAGILAGASMSGELKNPSKSIPKGTIQGLVVTFLSYLIVILSMGVSIPRKLLYRDTQILEIVNLSPFIILAGEMSTSIFSIIVGIVGAAQLLQAIAKDEILPGLQIFAENEKLSILVTWIICQLFLFADLNQIAIFITMAFLLTFIITNMACALLKMGSAPNFRPSFKYFSTKSAILGTMLSFITMLIVDSISAIIVFIILILLIIFIHFISPPKSWGDVSQSLIYHQVRKYLLKLRQDNVKYWRPQILLLIDNPRTSWKLITFCNHLKKGGLYILGHVFIIKDFQENIQEFTSMRDNWIKIRDLSKVKAFVQISIAESFNWGVRNIFIGSGLGGMKPNITIIGFYDLSKYRDVIPEWIHIENEGEEFDNQVRVEINSLPTDQRAERSPKVGICEWIETLEDLSLLNSNIGVGKGFSKMVFPSEATSTKELPYIDLYPIQMAQRIQGDEAISTINFDTCTLILQLGAILHTVPTWRRHHRLRVVVFVEDEGDMDEEYKRVRRLLEILRMSEATIKVVSLNGGSLRKYEYISRGDSSGLGEEEVKRINELLEDDPWWQRVIELRKERANNSGCNNDKSNNKSNNSKDSLRYNKTMNNRKSRNFEDIRRIVGPTIRRGRRMTVSDATEMGFSLGRMNFQAGGIQDMESDVESVNVSGNVNAVLKSDASSIISSGKFTAARLPMSRIRRDAEGNDASIMWDDHYGPNEGLDIEGDVSSVADYSYGDVNGDNCGYNYSYSYNYNCGYSNGYNGNNIKVEFASMTRRAQFLVLNELMGQISPSGVTALLLTTLPCPAPGTHNSHGECLRYCVDLALWTMDFPPSLLVAAKTVTVTSNL